MKKILSVLILLLLCFSLCIPIFAQSDLVGDPPKEETLEAMVVSILEEKEIEIMGKKQQYQKLKLQVTKGSGTDSQIIIENGDIPVANNQLYKVNDKVLVTKTKDFEGKDSFYISDFIRRDTLMKLFLIFVILAIVIA